MRCFDVLFVRIMFCCVSVAGICVILFVFDCNCFVLFCAVLFCFALCVMTWRCTCLLCVAVRRFVLSISHCGDVRVLRHVALCGAALDDIVSIAFSLCCVVSLVLSFVDLRCTAVRCLDLLCFGFLRACVALVCFAVPCFALRSIVLR